jgi:DNA transformation protein
MALEGGKRMAADTGFRDEVMDLLAPLGPVSCRSMFGGFGIFFEGTMFALISGTGLFFKVDDSNRSAYSEAGSKQYGRMPYHQIPASVLRNEAELLQWAGASIAVARAAPRKKQRQP